MKADARDACIEEINCRRNNRIDALKGLAAVMVVFIHYPFPGTAGQIVEAYARFAVPFFFLCSGYYYHTHCEKAQNGAKQEGIQAEGLTGRRLRLMKTGCLLIGASLYSLLFETVHQGSLYAAVQEFLTLEGFVKWLFLNDTGVFVHLWYLWALLYCYLVWRPTDYRRGSRRQRDLLLILLGAGYLLGILCRKMELPVSLSRNWLFTGIPFFGLGYLYPKSKPVWKKIGKEAACVGILCTYAEWLLLGNLSIYIGSCVLAWGVFSWAIEDPGTATASCAALFGRKYSVWMYILHWGIMHIEYKIISVFSLGENAAYMAISPMILTLYTIGCAIAANAVVGYAKSKIRLLKTGKRYITGNAEQKHG